MIQTAALAATAAAAGMLYSWLGLAYAATMILAAGTLGAPVGEAVVPILASQALVSLAGAAMRRGSVEDPPKKTAEAILTGLAAVAAVAGAATVGVALPDHYRLAGVAAVSLLAAAGALAGERSPGKTAGAKAAAATGLAAGLVKGVLAAGATPALIALHRLLGTSIDETMYKTLLAETVVTLAALAPYAAAEGAQPLPLAVVTAAALGGAALGAKTIRPLSEKAKRRLAAGAMAGLPAALFIRLLALPVTA